MPDVAPARKVRVCLIGPSLDIVGGQSVQLQRLLVGLGESDHLEVSFLPVNPRLPGALRVLQRVKYVRTIVTSIAYGASLVRAARTNDVLHAFSASYWSYILAPLPAMLIGRLWGRATVLNYHSGEADDHLSTWKRTAVPTMRRFATRIVVPSGYLVHVFGSFGLSAEAISNSVPIEMLPYRRRKRLLPRFLSNRNLEPLYNVACTVRAFALVQRKFPDASLVIAGDGRERVALELLVSELQLSNVTFMGRVPPNGMGAHYEQADIYFNSPNIDNMPLSILEAFACGLPVVSSNAGGIPFLVTSGTNGVLVERNDHEAMAAAALHLLDEPAVALSLADAARAECESKYTWPHVQRAWESLYLSLAPAC
ncbi:glycosyltransferase family 4 protein [Gemmatimonas sp.]|uniref:glycosyltransferase family 4 protein n=1 Tax=Gemmatimonas sp. TaxID=1962908 RepID=UPI003566DBD1